MKKSWIITDKHYSTCENIQLLEGYALSRDGLTENNTALLKKVYFDFKLDFINHIKGHFIIQVKDYKGNIHIYTDHIGIKKLFYWKNEDQFIISDSIDEIVREVQPKLSTTNLALHSLFHHFVGGRTMYEDIFYSKPASHFIITPKGEFSVQHYWSYEELVNQNEKNYTYSDFADKLESITKESLQLTHDKNVTMTLTGGMDSRIVLGTLLSCNVKPYAFTFGNVNSADVICSTKIANAYNLDYNNYNYPKPTAKWYSSLSNEIVEFGNTMVHIHRSHRLDAAKREKEIHPDVDTIFLGAMGGEGIRGLHYDDLITTAFVRRLYENKENLDDLIIEKLNEYFHDISGIDVDELKGIISELSFIKNDYKTNQFYLLYDLVASLHDTQDITIYYTQYKNVICPFLDIDYLEMLFSSNYNLFKKEATSHSIRDRLIIPQFHCNVSDKINKQLSKFQFSNGFSPREYLRGKYYYLMIRGVRILSKRKFPPNFPYNEWFHVFVNDGLEMVKNNSSLRNIFDINKAQKEFYKNKSSSKEGFWHKYSNIIMVNFNSNE